MYVANKSMAVFSLPRFFSGPVLVEKAGEDCNAMRTGVLSVRGLNAGDDYETSRAMVAKCLEKEPSFAIPMSCSIVMTSYPLPRFSISGHGRDY